MNILDAHREKKALKHEAKATKRNNKMEYKANLKKEKADYKPLKQEFLLNGAKDFQNVYIDYDNKKLLLLDKKKHSAVSKSFSDVKDYEKYRTTMSNGIKSKRTYNSVNNTANISFTIRFFDGDVRIVSIYSNLIQIKKMERYASEIENTLRSIVEENNKSNTVESSNDLDQLTKLKELADAGVITEEEFNAKKKQVLGI